MALAERLWSWFPRQKAEVEAGEVFRFLWKQTARAGSTRHPFHREVLIDLDALLGIVEAAPPDTMVEIDGTCLFWGDVQRKRCRRRLKTGQVRRLKSEHPLTIGE